MNIRAHGNLVTITPIQFQTKLLKWFDKNGRKHLPWQRNKTPYRVWISEIMLQQTQVSTVIPYFERFMQSFPDLTSLANAHEDDVLHHWAGLGYYSRARNLHRAAKIIIENFNGELPHTSKHLQSLPGIGQSTAGAILSIAFDQPAAILDGNVKRVLARFHAISAAINDKATEATLWQIAQKYTPKNRTADYTQAMMDLGATCCTRSKPQCTQCPLKENCAAHHQGIAHLLPQKKAAKALPIRCATFLILLKKNQVLLLKRPAKGIWGGLWSLPEIAEAPQKKLLQTFCQQHLQLKVKDYQALPHFRHTFSHYHLDICPILISLTSTPTFLSEQMEAVSQIWYNLEHPETIGLPKPVQSLLNGLKTNDTSDPLRQIKQRSRRLSTAAAPR